MLSLNSPRRRTPMCALTCSLLLSAAPHAQAVVDGLPIPTSDTRFDAVGLLLTSQPGADCGGWVSGSCTLIAPDVVLLARHSVQTAANQMPAPNGHTHRVRFRRAEDGRADNHFAGNPGDCHRDFQEIEIREFTATSMIGVELVIGYLASAPVGIAPIPVDTTFTAPEAAPVILAGWGFSGRCFSAGEAWTLRSSSGVLPPERRVSPCCFLYNNAGFDGSCISLPRGADWVVGNLHDSGAPLLIDIGNGELRVAAMVTSQSNAQLTSAWNFASGEPAFPLEPVVTLPPPPPPPPCDAEFDGVPGLTESDLFAFVDAWLNRDDRCNVDGREDVTLSDLLWYLQRYAAGC